MYKKRRTAITVVLVLLILFSAGCGTGRKIKDTGIYMYYVNAEENALVKQNYELSGKDADANVKEMLKDLRKGPEDTIESKSVVPAGVDIDHYELKDKILTLYFTEKYLDIPKAQEVLLRAAVVQTLVQVGGVDYVVFYAGDKPLADKSGQAVGLMQAEDFVQNTGSSINSYQLASLVLYFANDSGNKLVKETVSVRYNSSMSMEKLIVEQLMRGPASDSAKPTITPKVKLLSATVKDGICYVNFSEGFLESSYNLKPEIPVYSIVNSIIEGGQASQVQISVNGKKDILYQENISLKKPLERNLDIVEEEKK